MTITKNIFRQKCLKKIKNSGLQNKLYKTYLINKRLMNELSSQAGNKKLKILFYYPLPFEADVRKTLLKMRKKHQVYIPFMEGASFKMVPFRLPLKKKKFNNFEAGNTVKKIKNISNIVNIFFSIVSYIIFKN
jgi:5-formyltetrahydrofolate cyclo-ligase